MNAWHKKEYHNAFPGGYVDHVLRVVQCALKVNKVWVDMGVDTSTYSVEELVFASLNGNTKIVKYLIEKGADVNAKDEDNDTALIVASEKGQNSK